MSKAEKSEVPYLLPCTVIGGRCSTMCMTQSQLERTFVFTFVRDPVDRFYSSYVQSLQHQGVDTKRASWFLRRSSVVSTLERMRICASRDLHLESIAMSLSSPIYNGAMVPLDYIGLLDDLSRGFFNMLNYSKRMDRLSERDKIQLHTQLNQHSDHGLAELSAVLRAQRDEKLDAMVASTYAQDIACFGK